MAKKAKAPAPKTNACRVLDELDIAYELRAYEYDPDDLAAERVAEKLQLPPSQVYKTLCIRSHDGAIQFAVVAADRKLDLKAAARVAGVRSFAPVQVKELPQLTGYIRGGVTALASKKPYPTWVDARIFALPTVSISAGQRGLQILLAPSDYARATQASVGTIAL